MVEAEEQGPTLGPIRRLFYASMSILVAMLVWAPLLHLLFVPSAYRFRSEDGISPIARKLARRHLELWTDPEKKQQELEQMRASNAEWDFMGRTFLVLALANMCLRDPSLKQDYLPVMDAIIDETERLLAEGGDRYFLMDYAREAPFVQEPPRSIFIDGEVALMIAARRFIEDRQFATPLRDRVDLMVERMRASPAMSCESYPNECWMFCNTVALVAIKMHDLLDGANHAAFIEEWLDFAKQNLTHKETGLLCSSYTYDGLILDGPEGSTIWMAAHCLQAIDPVFAEDQYQHARKELRRTLCGFAWGREWPSSWVGQEDVDSGPVIPILDISAGSSGMAFLGAASFDDDTYYRALARTVLFAGMPVSHKGQLKFCASNQVGDAVLLYSTVLGPLWDEVHRRDQAGAAQ